jgi:hypothetical protein
MELEGTAAKGTAADADSDFYPHRILLLRRIPRLLLTIVAHRC